MKKSLLFLCVGVLVGYALDLAKLPSLVNQNFSNTNSLSETQQPLPATQNPPITDNQEVTQKPLDTLITLDMPKGPLLVLLEQDVVFFQPIDVASSSYEGMSIEKSKYPPLFAQGVANSSFITAEKHQLNGEYYVLLTNNQPDHGGYAMAYGLLVNPLTREIKEYKSTEK